MKLAITLFALVLPSAATAGELSNGIYSVAGVNADTGTIVTRSDDGDQIKLQKLLASGFGTVSVVATSNDNDRFRLTLKGAGPFRTDIKSVHQAAYIDGVCVIGTGQDLNDQRRSTLVGDFTSIDNAQKIAKALSIDPQLRQHPGHRVIVKWTPTRNSFKASEPIELTLTVDNVGDIDVTFVAGGSQRGPRDNQFSFIAHSGSGHGKAVPDTGDPMNFGGPGTFVKLRPGESFTKKVDVTKWFRFSSRDRYKLTCLYHIVLTDGEDNGPIWDEFLTGQCFVRINE
jgi:hypothetical protein